MTQHEIEMFNNRDQLREEHQRKRAEQLRNAIVLALMDCDTYSSVYHTLQDVLDKDSSLMV